MAVRIRMKRLGRRHRPFFRICIMDQRKPRNGQSIEEVGTYDPMVRDKSARVLLKMDRIDYWISVGAQPSEKVAALIRKVKLNKFGSASAPPPMTAPKEPPAPEPEPEAATEEAPAEATTEETPADESTDGDAGGAEAEAKEETAEA